MVSNKIMKAYENKDAIVYRAMCDCGSSGCDLTLDVEKAPDLGMVFLTLYKTLSWTSYEYSRSWIRDFFWRVSNALKILFWGEIKVEGDFVMREEQMDAFIKALQEAKETLKGEVS